jgi:uncharacterized membrane protein YGL010W
VSPALVLAALLVAYYLALDLPFGVAMAVLFAALLASSAWVAALPLGYAVCGAVFALSWLAQAVGHKVFEHRKPALLDDLWQVFVAPIFVVAEWAFLAGLRKPLHAQVRQGMQAHVPKA